MLHVHMMMSTIAKDILNLMDLMYILDLMIFRCVIISKDVATDVTLLCSFFSSLKTLSMHTNACNLFCVDQSTSRLF